jgi:hypothetical protein
MANDKKYNSVIDALGKPLPTWVTDAQDQRRVAAYDGYDEMYMNTPGTFVVRGGQTDVPIYVPSAKKIVEAIVRYLGKDWRWTVESADPAANADPENNATIDLTLAFHNLFVREEFRSKLFSLKRHMVQRGDAVFHITANLAPSVPAGMRISIDEPHARNVFAIPHPTNDAVTVGYYLVDLIYADDGTTQIARRQEYRYDPKGTGQIWSQLTFWETNAWDDRWVGHPALKPVAAPLAYAQDPVMALAMKGGFLPASIRALPIYVFRNQREGGEPWGTSQIAGLETLVGGVNNTITDEDITLALNGLGVFVTDSARPVDESGAETDWVVAPGSVMEVKPGTKFERVAGVSTNAPFQEHLNALKDAIDESAGLSATAIGNVDANVAASGVALRLDMAPILAQNEEKEVEIIGRLDQMFFDLLTMWLPLDGISVPPGMMIMNVFGDPLPRDRAAILAEVIALRTAGLITLTFAVEYLQQMLGFQFPPEMLAQLESEDVGAVGGRIATEAAGAPEGDPSGTPAVV